MEAKNKKNIITTLKWLAVVVVVLVIGLKNEFHTSPHRESKGACSNDFPLLDQHIDCESLNEKIVRVKNLELEVVKLIEQKKKNTEITSVSVFYRDLNSRRWFGVNADENFYPASLLKLPTAITYFKLAETNPKILSQKIEIPKDQKDQNQGQYFKVNSPIAPGNTYTIKELIKSLLINSDNNPIQTLNQNLPNEYSYNVYRDLGLPEPTIVNNKSSWEITVRIYAGILRALYISSYLNPESSETILSYLAKTTFDDGLRAAIPTNIKIAHKFGEASLVNSLNGDIETRVLHDCGIVYYPKNPYIICIMTSGKNITQLTQTIQDITRIVNGSILPNEQEDQDINQHDDD